MYMYIGVRVYVFGEIGKSYPIRGVVSLSIHDVSLDRFRTISINGDLNRMQTNRAVLSSVVIGRMIDSQLASFLDRIDTGYASFSMFRRTEAKRSSLAVGIQLTVPFLVGTQGYS